MSVSTVIHDALAQMVTAAVSGTPLDGHAYEGEAPAGVTAPFCVWEAVDLREDDHITGQTQVVEAAMGVQIHLNATMGRRAARQLADHVYEQLISEVTEDLPDGLERVELMGDRMPTISRQMETWLSSMDLLLFIDLTP